MDVNRLYDIYRVFLYLDWNTSIATHSYLSVIQKENQGVNALQMWQRL